MPQFTTDNTIGYTSEQLASANALFEARANDELDHSERSSLAEQVLREIDDQISADLDETPTGAVLAKMSNILSALAAACGTIEQLNALTAFAETFKATAYSGGPLIIAGRKLSDDEFSDNLCWLEEAAERAILVRKNALRSAAQP